MDKTPKLNWIKRAEELGINSAGKYIQVNTPFRGYRVLINADTHCIEAMKFRDDEEFNKFNLPTFESLVFLKMHQ